MTLKSNCIAVEINSKTDKKTFDLFNCKIWVEIFLNGLQTVNYTETDNTIPQQGLIGLQIHGGGKTKVSYKNIFITEMR